MLRSSAAVLVGAVALAGLGLRLFGEGRAAHGAGMPALALVTFAIATLIDTRS